MKRRDFLKLGLAAGGVGVLASKAFAQDRDLLKYLCPPDGFPPDLSKPSPYANPFEAELFIPPVMTPVEKLDPPPDPRAHQRYSDFPPKKFYEIHEREFAWLYHPAPPYGKGSLSWGFWAKNSENRGTPMTPGPVYHARYGESVLVRRYNDLPPVGQSKVTFALPSTTSHLHNGHTASESDGNPQDWIDSGEFWDHHYANYPSGGDPSEKLTSLWYHDHRLDFTAAIVYAGLSGFYFLFDQQDSGNENDPNP
ncbi:MAG: copper oxidase, partial [Methylococcales bacterium]